MAGKAREMTDWKFIRQKYTRKLMTRIYGSDSITWRYEDGYKLHFLRQYESPSPEYFARIGQETFDVALKLKGDVAIDVGAHIGSYSLRLARNFNWVYAFEPNPKPLKALLKNLALNNIHNVQVEQCAISDQTRWRKLRIPSKFLPGTTLANSHYSWLDFDQEMEIRAYSLDDYFKGYNHRFDFVKIDVEGHELAVLNGMKRLIKQNPSMVLSVEVHRPAETLTSCDCPVCEWLKIEGLKTELHGRYTSGMDAHWVIAR